MIDGKWMKEGGGYSWLFGGGVLEMDGLCIGIIDSLEVRPAF